MQDGAPLHNHMDVWAWLNENFPNKWIERGEPSVFACMKPRPLTIEFYSVGVGEIKGILIKAKSTSWLVS